MASSSSALLVIGLGLLVSAACDNGQRPVAPAFSSLSGSPTTPTSVSPASPPVASTNDAFEGLYTLTVDVGSECSAIPGNARRRTYAATISSSGEGKYIVTLTEGQFLWGPICNLLGVGCHQFFASRQGEATQFDLVNNNDDAHGGHIVEQLSDATWIEIIGSATGLFRGTTIEASGPGSVWYCPTPSSYPFPCNSYTSCKSSSMRLTFNRR